MKPSKDWLLLGGAALGIVLAGASLLQAPKARVPDDAVAVVNGRAIRKDEYQAALAAVAADTKSGSVDAELRRHVLERLIDEELLVQAALELGLAERDRRVRADLSSATLGFIREAPAADPSDAELEAFYRDNAGWFSSGGRIEVREKFFAGQDARARAEQAREKWDEAPADASPLPLPSGALPLSKLEQYLGESAARAVLALAVGEVSAPLAAGSGYRLVRVVARSEGTLPPWSEARELALTEWRRRRTERELRRFLAERRARARIELAGERGS